jgi:hypothetical protein
MLALVLYEHFCSTLSPRQNDRETSKWILMSRLLGARQRGMATLIPPSLDDPPLRMVLPTRNRDCKTDRYGADVAHPR